MAKEKDKFAPSAATLAALEDRGVVQSQSILHAIVCAVLGFPIDVKIATELKKGELTGKRDHLFQMRGSHSVMLYDGTTRDYHANWTRAWFQKPSRMGRLCRMDDLHPEHPALYCAQAILNYVAIMRHIHEGAPLFQSTWDHTPRTALLNSEHYEPYAYLLDELATTGGQLGKRKEKSVVKPARIDVTSIDGASEKVVTSNAPVAVAMATCGFTIQPHIVDPNTGRSLFLMSPVARIATTSVLKDGEPVILTKWKSEDLRDKMSEPSKMGRANAIEDICPELSIMYAAQAISGYFSLMNAIRRGPDKGNEYFKAVSDKTPMSAYLTEGNTAGYDHLKRMFRRSGQMAGKPKLI